jgi:uncharacterized protein (DUF305 family)
MKRNIMMNSKTLLTALIALVIGLALGWIAAPKMGGMMNHEMGQMGSMDHSMMDMSTPKGDQGPSSMAYAKANADMHTGMAIEFTGNSDIDFAKGMIPHHQGAVAMAKIQLEHGKDPDMRKLAEDIIKAQDVEIKFMTDWLAKNAK